MSSTLEDTGSLRRGEKCQNRQGLDAFRPWQRREHHETEPAQTACLDKMTVAGTNWIAIDPARGDLWAPAPLNRVIQADHVVAWMRLMGYRLALLS